MVQQLNTEVEENPYIVKFLQFFGSQCRKEIEHLVSEYPQKRSLNIDFKELEKFDYNLADELLDNPEYLLDAAQDAIEKVDVPSLEIEKFFPHVRFFNLPQDRKSLLRNIGSQHLNKLIAIEGIIKQITDVLPKLEIAVWKCRRCGNTYRVEQTSSQEIKQPAFCECRHRDFTLMEEESEFIDYQKITVQEPLELLRGNEQPTDLNIYLSDDLVNKVAAGDRILVSGLLKLNPGKKVSPVFGRFVNALHIEETSKEFADVEILSEEVEEIKDLAKDPKIFEKLVASVAPAIYGHEIVKEAIILQLFGGVKKVLPGNQSIRGNIHVLLVGDPGVAKSAILTASSKISPKSIYVAGKTTTGVGLCVAPETLILNDNGFKEIKEFVEGEFDKESSIEELPNAFSNNFEGKCYSINADLKIEDSKIYKIWKIKPPEKMIKIMTRLGKEICLTPQTPLLVFREEPQWVKASDITIGEYVACARKLPAGTLSKVPLISFLEHNSNIRIKNNIALIFKEITNNLLKKYGSLQNIARKMKKSRDTIYSIRNSKFYHGIALKDFLELGREAGYSDDELSAFVEEIFIRHGRNIKIPRYLDSEELAYLAGLVLGDGNISKNKGSSTSVRIFSDSPELLQAVDSIVEKNFGIKPEAFDDGKRVPGMRIKFIAFFEIMKAFGVVEKKQDISISHTATQMNNKVLAALLRGLFDTDGYVSLPTKHRGSPLTLHGCAEAYDFSHKKSAPISFFPISGFRLKPNLLKMPRASARGASHVGISSISKNLIQRIQLCLLKFGISSKLRFRKMAGKVCVGKKLKITKRFDEYVIEIRGKQNLEKFKENIGFNLKRKNEKLDQVIKNISKAGHSNIEKIQGNDDLVWEEIENIVTEKPSAEFVYDFSVQDNHNFIGNGFIVHNTATAVKDEFGEGGWTLKAGALVLASGGIVMADELDKMLPEDRSSLHEAMEQGKISVAKAGMVTQFKTETSILAAANPKFSRFDPFMSFMEQVDLPSTLISRFDLFFMIKDVLDRTRDTEIASHILKTHQSGQRLAQHNIKGKPLDKKELEEIEKIVTPVINPELLRKYIAYTRQNIFPTLSKEAIQLISDFYVNLRERGKEEGAYAATHRQLEGLVRLSEAAARVRLKDVIEKEEAERAIRLLRFSLEDVVKDPETGKIDYDIIAAGQTHSQTEGMKKILRIIKDKAKEVDEVTLEDVFEEAKIAGIEREKAEELLRKLESKGEVYRPRHNLVKPTQFK